ncbi:MAG: hypothetical protein IPP40_13335 [bacterium]|nr:hypothetical protein [bacterium]
MDISDPTVINEVAVYDCGYVTRVVVEDNVAYVACNSDGLRIVDVSDPTKSNGTWGLHKH